MLRQIERVVGLTKAIPRKALLCCFHFERHHCPERTGKRVRKPDKIPMYHVKTEAATLEYLPRVMARSSSPAIREPDLALDDPLHPSVMNRAIWGDEDAADYEEGESGEDDESGASNTPADTESEVEEEEDDELKTLLRLSKQQLAEEVMRLRKCKDQFGTAIFEMPEDVQASRYGFSSMARLHEFAEKLRPHVQHPSKNTLYEYMNALKATLHMLRRGDPNRFIFNLLPLSMRKNRNYSDSDPTSTLRRWQKKIMDGIVSFGSAEHLVAFLSPKEWLEDTSECPEFLAAYPLHLVLHVDGTVCEIETPTVPTAAQATYNSKHGINSWQIFILVTQTGRIVYMSSVEGGKMHDKTHYCRDDVSRQLYEFYSKCPGYKDGTIKIGRKLYQLTIGGDKAYKNLVLPKGWRLLLTKSAEDHDVNLEQAAHDGGVDLATAKKRKARNDAGNSQKKLKKDDESNNGGSSDATRGWPQANITESQRFDTNVAPFRSVVERVMKALKRWHILLTRIHLTPRRVTTVFKCVCILTNYQLKYDCDTHW